MSGAVTIHIRLRRDGDPAKLTTFELPEPSVAGISAESWSGASVSTALQYLQQAVDPGLAYSLSCRRGLCDTCAMRIDGVVTTACTVPVHDGMIIEPAKPGIFLRDTIVELSLVRKARIGPEGQQGPAAHD